MSTVSTPLSPLPPSGPPPGDPFRYGWRDVTIRRPDGTTDYEQVPLTLDDVVHPQEGDVILEGSLHDLMCAYLAGVFRWRLRDDPRALVLSDTGVYWEDRSLRHHSPDVCVILGVSRQKVNWSSYDIATEKARPALIIELVSPNVREADVVTKFKQYHLAKVPIYVIVDRKKESDPWELLGYQYTPSRFEELAKDTQGRLWLEPVRLWLGVDGFQVKLFDSDTGEGIPDDTGARVRAVKESERAASAEARVRELEAENARLRSQRQD